MSSIGSPRRLLVALASLAAAALAEPTNAQTFGSTLNLSNSSGGSGGGQIAIVSPNVYVVWVDSQANHQPPARFSRSTNGGASFSSPVTVLSSGIQEYAPHVAAAGSNVYVARNARPKRNQQPEIYFGRSTNNGASWGTETKLTTGGAGLLGLVADGNNVFVVSGRSGEIFVLVSHNGGASFTNVNASNTATSSGGSLRLIANGSTVHLVWTEELPPAPGSFECYYSRSLDTGASFSPPVNLTNTPVNSSFCTMAVAGSNVYVGYREYLGEYRLIRSLDNGTTFTTPVDVSLGRVDTNGLAGGPKLAATGSDLHVIWHGDAAGPGIYNVYHRSSTDSGNSFGAITNLSNNLSNSATPAFGTLAAEGPNAYVAYSTGGEVYSRHSGDSGASFDPAVNVSNNAGASYGVLIAAEASPAGVHAIWTDSTLGKDQIFYRRGSIP